LSIRLFLVLQAFSDFTRGALATPVSQTRSLHGRLQPALPPKRNFLYEFARGTLAVAIPNTGNFRGWATTTSEYPSKHTNPPKPEPFANVNFIGSAHLPRLHSGSEGGFHGHGRSQRRCSAELRRDCLSRFRFQSGFPMSFPEQNKKVVVESTSDSAECRAELIFYARTASGTAPPVAILGQYACDYRRPDWEHRWTEWNSGQNPYLHLFLCSNHARAFGLIGK